MTQVHAVIQAGGMGQRIRAVEPDTPKPLLPVGGVPMIERLVQQLADAGIRRMTVIIGPNGAAIRARVARQLTRLPADLDVSFFEERTALGNSGALGEIDTGDDDVLLCFADLVTAIDFAALIRVHRERRHDVTLTSHYEHHQLTLGELVVDGDTVRGYQEKPRKAFLICSGIAIFDARAMAVARALPRPYGISNLVLAALAAGCSVTHWQHGAYWIDVNTPELLEQARDDAAVAGAAATTPPGIRRQAG
jgi:NDP-sugar pyrophosphorylase family protein